MKRYHRSVMTREVIEYICISESGRYADFTFGEGGHSEALIEKGASEVTAFDRDPEAVATYREGGDLKADPRLRLIQAPFSECAEHIAPGSLDGIVMDLGVSTRQLVVGERGFSFSSPGPLDMRMDTENLPPLSDWLSRISPTELARQLEKNADLRKALPLARDLLEEYRRGRVETTADLAQIAGSRSGKRHPATVIFLALRMMVNDELGEIERGIPAALRCLKPGGRLAVITFHSTEDRCVKLITRQLAAEGRVSLVLKKPLSPGRDELVQNPRARSAKLRCVEKIDDNG